MREMQARRARAKLDRSALREETLGLRPVTMRLVTIAALFVVSASAIAEPASGSDTLVVVLQKPNGTRATHSQPIAADDCNAMLQLFKTLHEQRQALTLDLGAPAFGSAEVFHKCERRSRGWTWQLADHRPGPAAYRRAHHQTAKLGARKSFC